LPTLQLYASAELKTPIEAILQANVGKIASVKMNEQIVPVEEIEW
jgi:hypothetical protein